MKKKIAAALLLGTMTLSLVGCGHKTSYQPLDDTDDTIYSIAILSNGEDKLMEQGFIDALSDTFGEEHVNLSKTTIVSSDKSKSVQKLLDKGAQLLFTEDSRGLGAARNTTDETPIVSCGIINYPSELGTPYTDEEARTTGTNVTGISALPPISNQLSEMIEADPDMDAVGILYSPEDVNSVYQNRLLENYLNQAGIQWREYILPTDHFKDIRKNQNSARMRAIQASDDINPLNPQVSSNWNGGKTNSLLSHAKLTRKVAKENRSLAVASDTRIIRKACKECSTLYLACGSRLNTKVNAITAIARKTKVATFGGDAVSGAHTLTTLYQDPYDSGYRAGEMAYRILINGDDPSDMSIGLPDSSVFTKLYNASMAKALHRTFPKSFTEYKKYLSDYQPGSLTNRVGKATEEE